MNQMVNFHSITSKFRLRLLVVIRLCISASQGFSLPYLYFAMLTLVGLFENDILL